MPNIYKEPGLQQEGCGLQNSVTASRNGHGIITYWPYQYARNNQRYYLSKCKKSALHYVQEVDLAHPGYLGMYVRGLNVLRGLVRTGNPASWFGTYEDLGALSIKITY